MARQPRIVILKADGTNCEVETAHAVEQAGGLPDIVPVNSLRWGEAHLADYDGLVVPGGFSYGDDVVSGKILAVELMTRLADDLSAFAAAGKPILGICNGFQVLVRTGLLPFGDLGTMRATLAANASGRFECRWVKLGRAAEHGIAATLPERLELPSAHGEGRFWADEATLADLEARGLVALRYLDAGDRPTQAFPANPNGSLSAIAGVTDPSGRVLGLMPHPERHLARYQHPNWRRRPGELDPDGLRFFRAWLAAA
jgi:phosphoribosylformylglycinamidine synthase